MPKSTPGNFILFKLNLNYLKESTVENPLC
jgi:hypothetical protein